MGGRLRGQLFDRQDAATPLDDEEKEGLIPSYVTLRGELNEGRAGQHSRSRGLGLWPEAGCA